MYEKKIGSEKAVIVIHEIYGINRYIKDWADFFNDQGYDAYCIDLIHKEHCFSYAQQEEAYSYFTTQIGFDRYREVGELMKELGHRYDRIIVFGSSIGATIAWRLTDSVCCDGMIGYYGSRIRDYLDVNPDSPCLLLFGAEEESFDVRKLLTKLNQKENIQTAVIKGKHGFSDPYGENFDTVSAKKALDRVKRFLKENFT